MEADLRIQAEGGRLLEADRASVEYVAKLRWAVNDPGVGGDRAFDGSPPLDKPALLADVDLLAGADEADHGAPLGDAFREFDEVLGLRFASDEARDIGMLDLDLLGKLAIRACEKEIRTKWPPQCKVFRHCLDNYSYNDIIMAKEKSDDFIGS